MTTMELATAKYLSDEQTLEVDEPVQYQTEGRTTGLTVILSLCLLFGVWGMGKASIELCGMYLQASVPIRTDDEVVRMAQQIQQRYTIPLVFLGMVRFGVGAALVCSAIFLYTKRTSARSFACSTFVAVIAFNVCNVVVGVLIYRSSTAVLEAALHANNSGELTSADLGQVMNMMGIFVVIASLIGVMIKAAMYAFMMLHLNKPHIRAILGEEPFPELAAT